MPTYPSSKVARERITGVITYMLVAHDDVSDDVWQLCGAI
jgi:hypothetical protein